MNIVKLHQLIDEWAAKEREEKQSEAKPEGESTTETTPPRVLPEGQRVVRTKTQGDRVYLLDETKKTRQWVTKPEILDGLGFGMDDVIEVDDTEFMKYQMAAPIYKLADGTA